MCWNKWSVWHLDIDECWEQNGGCEGSCENTVGSYHCLCPLGYQLNYDNHTCLDVDECWPDKFNCSHECVNMEGSARCSCLHGYNLQDDGKSCQGEGGAASDYLECHTETPLYHNPYDVTQNSIPWLAAFNSDDWFLWVFWQTWMSVQSTAYSCVKIAASILRDPISVSVLTLAINSPGMTPHAQVHRSLPLSL